MIHRSILRTAVPLLPAYGTGLIVAGVVKVFYSRAGADELTWILAPTVRLVEILTGVAFEQETHSGWISHSHRMIVGPGCAGLNFLIIAFSTFYFTFVHRFGRFTARVAWLGGSLGTAALFTIATNAVRIMAAMVLLRLDIYGGPVTAERVHRLEGVVVYSLSLLLAYLTLERAGWWPEGGRRERWTSSPLVPLGWYLSIVVGVPLLNRAYRDEPSRFMEHTVLVFAVCLVVGAAVHSVLRIANRISRGLRDEECPESRTRTAGML